MQFATPHQVATKCAKSATPLQRSDRRAFLKRGAASAIAAGFAARRKLELMWPRRTVLPMRNCA
ncbi:twin-arginine translocation signal domain-containing protein [Bradyrhizobium sp. LB11.1]|uniref:twin-arginine translocation signal domain-containing protein n=1 Tax=Bradyrhizobium sp. LB11.1 TaxID=3156326 RepID=UPI003392151A